MSAQSVILNSSNWNPSTKSFVYQFPFSQKLENKSVGVSSISFYNSFFNISSAYGNNTVSVNYNGTVYNWTIPNGYYSYSDLNYWFQSQMIGNNLYMINSSSQYVYFLEIVANSVLYSGEINVYPVPTSTTGATLGYTIPTSGAWGTGNAPSITFNNAFGLLLGMEAGTLGGGAGTLTTPTQYVSTKCPIISPVNSIILTCNLVNNVGLSNPTNILASYGLSSGFGSLISYSSSDIIYQKCSNNTYTYLTIQILDQNLSILTPYDYEYIITLALKDEIQVVKQV